MGGGAVGWFSPLGGSWLKHHFHSTKEEKKIGSTPKGVTITRPRKLPLCLQLFFLLVSWSHGLLSVVKRGKRKQGMGLGLGVRLTWDWFMNNLTLLALVVMVSLHPLSLSLDCRAMFSNSFVRPVVFIESSREIYQNGLLSGFLYFKSIVIIDWFK